jgi:hypothetical protein
VDHNRTAVYGSTVDHGRQRPKGSPECGLGAAPVSRSSPAAGEKWRGDLRDPHRRQMGAVRRRWCLDIDEWRRRCVELGGRATRARVERINVRAGTVVWRRCSRTAFLGRGTTRGGRSRSNQRRLNGTSMAKPFRVGRKWGGEMGNRGRGTVAPIHFGVGEEGSSGWQERAGEVAAAAPCRASGGRGRSGSLTGWAHRSARDGRIGQVL